MFAKVRKADVPHALQSRYIASMIVILRLPPGIGHVVAVDRTYAGTHPSYVNQQSPRASKKQHQGSLHELL